MLTSLNKFTIAIANNYYYGGNGAGNKNKANPKQIFKSNKRANVISQSLKYSRSLKQWPRGRQSTGVTNLI